MKKKIIFLLLLFIFFPLKNVKALDVNYQTHVQNKGWLPLVSNGEIGGTTGQSLRMEAIKINKLNNEYEGSIEYQTHVQNKGWLPWVSNGEIGGTTGQLLRMEAIRIRLTGELAEHYNIVYRTHVQNKGWLPWVSNGEIGGTTGQLLRMEAIEIKVEKKENDTVENRSVQLDETNESISITYSTHNLSNWENYVNDGEVSGAIGKFNKIDLIKIKINNNTKIDGGIEYQTYNSTNNWLNASVSDIENGSSNVLLEAIKIRLTGSLEEKYNIFYRVHVSYIGWMGWTSNGEIAGTNGYFYPVEAIQIKLQPKDSSNIVTSPNSFLENSTSIKYTSHVQEIGWQDYVKDGEISGTTGRSLRLESIKIKLDSSIKGDIVYKTFISRRGWSSESSSDQVSGTTGLCRNLEAISIKLTGVISNYYDVYYRTHISNVGWLDWASNGEISGALNSNQKIEAIQIKIVKKGTKIDGSTEKKSVTGRWDNDYYYDCLGKKVTGFRLIDGVKYFFDETGKLMIKNAKKIIDVSSWQEDIDWDTIKKDEDVDMAIIRVGWGTSYNDECGIDSKFERNIKAVQRLNIPYAIYIYAYAEVNSAAEKEASFVVSKMKQYNIPTSTYVWYDAEISSISRDKYNSVIPTFVNKMKSSGYNNVGVYGGVRALDTNNGNLNTTTIRSYPIWVSQYYIELQYLGTYEGWQFQSDGRINGISGNVDVSAFK